MDVIRTARLQLRPLAEEDLRLYQALYGDESVMRHVRPPLSAAGARRSFASACRQQQALPARRRWWTVRTADEAVGLVGLGYAGEGAELGILLRLQWQGRGLAQEAVRALCAHAFEVQALAWISARHGAGNLAAHRLFAQAGFEMAAVAADECHWRLPADNGGLRPGAASGPRIG